MVCPNGVSVIILNKNEDILVVRHNNGENSWGLPGGGLEWGEDWLDAAVREPYEEVGLVLRHEDLHPVATLVQKIPKKWGGGQGNLRLFVCYRFTGSPTANHPEEVTDACFMSFQKIMEGGSHFGLGYRRLVLHYMRWRENYNEILGRLSDPVEYCGWKI